MQNKVNLIVPNLPQTAKQPVVQKFDPDAAPIMQIAVSAPRSLRDVTLIADKQIKQKLENAKGVGQITIVGGARREMHVLVDPDRLRAYNLTVTRRLQRGALAESGAARRQPERRREGVHGAHHRPRAGRDAVQPDHGGESRTATSSRSRTSGTPRTATRSRAAAARLDGVPAVTLVVAKQSGENTVATAAEVQQRLKEIIRRRCRRTCKAQIDQRSVGVHQGGRREHQAPPDRRQLLRRDHHLPVPGEHAHDADRGGRDSDLDHLDVRADGGDGLHAEPDHDAGADADGRAS